MKSGDAMRQANQRKNTLDRARNKLAAELRRTRVDGEHTSDELAAIHAGLKADYLAREARRRKAA